MTDSNTGTKTCTNCKQQIIVANFLIHESFCLRNIQLCNLCQKPMNKNLKEEHFKKFHEKKEINHELEEIAYLNNRNDDSFFIPCEFCFELFSSANLIDHQRLCQLNPLLYQNCTSVDRKKMLSDNEIYESLSILKEQFKHKTSLKGFFDPQLFNARFLKNENQISINTTTDKFIQILHDGLLHWYTLSNVKSINDKHIQIYDSFLMRQTYENNKTFLSNTKKLLAKNIRIDRFECEIKSVQIQSDPTMCGLYAIAFAFDLCNDIDPTSQNYNESKMRNHLSVCLNRRKFSEFPKTCDSFQKKNLPHKFNLVTKTI